MDSSVISAINKWPNVPDVFGWLSLDRRGDWLIKGDVIANQGICEFIGRNYEADTQGRWFFQNGPQRVFVKLDYAPYVLRTTGGEDALLETHTGTELQQITGAWIDEAGNIVLRWQAGVGSVSDRDLAQVLTWLTNSKGDPVSDETLIKVLESAAHHGSAGFWLNYKEQKLPVGRVLSRQAPRKFAYVQSPEPAPGQPDC